ncbi:MAG: hypothetical protein ABW170_02910 [Candidatus Thiodiazotropha sp. L084R]
MLALYPLWRKARRVYSLTSRLPGTNRLGFQPSLALSERRYPDLFSHSHVTDLHISDSRVVTYPARYESDRVPHYQNHD